MLKRYMHERERHFAMLNDNRVVNPFGWGTEFVGGSGSEADPRSFFAEYTNKAIDSSDEFFALPAKASVANLAEDADPGSGLRFRGQAHSKPRLLRTTRSGPDILRLAAVKDRRSSYCRTGTRKPAPISTFAGFLLVLASPRCG